MVFIFPFSFFFFFVSVLAETNRTPFDLPEAEGELVAGYIVEYSAVGFVLFFVAEYLNIIFQSVLIALIFLGGWFFPLGLGFSVGVLVIKILGILFLFVWVRAAFPRYRYDQLMRLGWKVFLPLSLGFLLFSSGILLSLDFLPFTIF